MEQYKSILKESFKDKSLDLFKKDIKKVDAKRDFLETINQFIQTLEKIDDIKLSDLYIQFSDINNSGDFSIHIEKNIDVFSIHNLDNKIYNNHKIEFDKLYESKDYYLLEFYFFSNK